MQTTFDSMKHPCPNEIKRFSNVRDGCYFLKPLVILMTTKLVATMDAMSVIPKF